MKLKKREKAIIWLATLLMSFAIVFAIIAVIVLVFSYIYAATNNIGYPMLWLFICIVLIVFLFLRE